jgi:hypothetical protein
MNFPFTKCDFLERREVNLIELFKYTFNSFVVSFEIFLSEFTLIV